MSDNFSQLSIDITKKLSKKTKKDNGIFFTSNSIRKQTIDIVQKFMDTHNIKILEPSCGSCEFIMDLKSDTNQITGIEFNEEIYNGIKHLSDGNIQIINDDFLKHDFKDNKYNLIIGNPPYFLLTNKHDYDDYNFFSGKNNIFCLFIYRSIQLLEEDGIISFVLPISFLNTKSYHGLRKYIYDEYSILDVSKIKDDKNNFLETSQDVVIFTMQKNNNKQNNNKFVHFIHDDFCIYVENINEIKDFNKDKVKIEDIKNIEVKTGNIVWNTHKSELMDNKTDDNKLLIYDKNFDLKGNFCYIKKTNEKDLKKQYIKTKNDKYISPPFVLIKRGRGQKSKFELFYVGKDFKYSEVFIENHMYYITGDEDTLKKIYKELTNKKTVDFVNKLYCSGNLTKTDIVNLHINM